MAGRRKLTVAQQVEQKRKRLQERELKAVGGAGSLFVGEAATVTSEQAYWQLRREWAGGGGATSGLGSTFWSGSRVDRGIMWLEIATIERYAVDQFGELGRAAAEYARRTYPMPDYGRSVWHDWLTGRKLVPMRHERVELGGGRVRVNSCDPFPPSPVRAWMTDAEFDGMFPPLDGRGDDLDDDPAGLFPRVMAALTQGGL